MNLRSYLDSLNEDLQKQRQSFAFESDEQVEQPQWLTIYPELEDVSKKRLQTFYEEYSEVFKSKDGLLLSFSQPAKFDYASFAMGLALVVETEIYFSFIRFLEVKKIVKKVGPKDRVTFGNMVGMMKDNKIAFADILGADKINNVLKFLFGKMLEARNGIAHSRTVYTQDQFHIFFTIFKEFYIEHLPVLFEVKKMIEGLNDKKKSEAYSLSSFSVSASVPPITREEIDITLKHLGEVIEQLCFPYLDCSDNSPEAKKAEDLLNAFNVWRLYLSEGIPTGFNNLMPLWQMMVFVNEVHDKLKKTGQDERDIIYLTIIFYRLLHIYYATDAVDFAKINMPKIYEQFPKQLCEEINWDILSLDLNDFSYDTRPSSSGQQEISLEGSCGTVSQEQNVQDEIEKLSIELAENCPQVKTEPFNQGRDYWQELDNLVGLKKMKAELKAYLDSHKVQLARKREHPDLKINTAFNCIFKGNPGTGKTTVARLIAGILRQEGVISSGHLVETSDAQLCSQWVGMTPKLTKYIALKSQGGVLFIDEAYNLANHKGSKSDTGKEVIDTLTPMLENSRSGSSPLIVILAGYDEEMDEFLSKSNTGFGSRFQYVLHFDDYNSEEMLQIFHNIVIKNYYYLSHEAEKMAVKLFRHLEQQRKHLPTFANARTVRSLFEIISKKANARVAQHLDTEDKDIILADDMKLTREELMTACGKIF